MSTDKDETKDITRFLRDRRPNCVSKLLKLAAMLLLVILTGTRTPLALATTEPDGSLDLPFDAGNFTNGQLLAAVLQPDGKLLIAGQFNKVHGVPRHNIARLNTNGTLDLSFDSGSGPQSSLKGMIVQPDGKIIIFGPGFGFVNGANRFAGIARLNSDGSLDTAFDPGRGISLDGIDDGSGGAVSPGSVRSAVLQPDGKVVVVGRFFHVITGPGTSVPRSCVARFNSDGTFDASYNPGTGAVYTFDPDSLVVSHAVRQSSGKIVVQGDFNQFDDHPDLDGLVRLNTDGSFDSTFTPSPTTFRPSVAGLFVQSDDQVVVFGSFTAYGGASRSGIVRLNSSGVVDVGFNTAVFLNYDLTANILSVAQQPNGRLIVGGLFHSLGGVAANNVVRLETNGAKDAGFAVTAAGPLASNVSVVLVRPSDSKIFAGGYFSSYGGAPRQNLAWVNDDGSVDSTFAGLGGAADAFPQIYAFGTQPDGKILVGGFFSSFNGTSRYNIVRLNPDSTIDPSFDANLGTYGSVRALHIQPDGKILIAGLIQSVSGVARGGVARLNSDGTLDSSFDPGTGANNIIYALTQDSAGNVYVGGAFDTFNGASRFFVAKLSSTGALDSTFNQAGGGASSTVFAIAPPDGTGGIVIGGQFSSYNGQTARRIARLNVTTGDLDVSFTPPGPTFGFSGIVFTLALAPDGKYYAGGSFTSYSGTPRSRVARLNANGTIDASFVPPTNDGIVYELALQNGKVYVGGSFTTLPGRIVRLTSSGALDSTFVNGTGIDTSPANAYLDVPEVTALGVQADNKLLIGGIFNKYNGVNRICLARLTTAPAGPPSILGNISTRLRVLTGDNALIGGMIATGAANKKVILRAIGPTLTDFGVPGALMDPTLDLYQGNTLLSSNDDWRISSQQAEIEASGFAPNKDAESAIIWTLTPGQNYTAIVRGKNNTTGIGVVEAFDLDHAAASKLGNISTRGFVDEGDNVMIAGLIVTPNNGGILKILARAIGPTLSDFGVPNALANPTLDLVNSNGTVIRSNDNWKDDSLQRSIVEAAGLAPSHDEEAALVETVAPGAYTAIVRGIGSTPTGVGLVEVYHIP